MYETPHACMIHHSLHMCCEIRCVRIVTSEWLQGFCSVHTRNVYELCVNAAIIYRGPLWHIIYSHSVMSVSSLQDQAVRVWDIYPDNDSFCVIAIQRHAVKVVYLVSQVYHYSHMSMHKKNWLITVITATKRTTCQHNPSLPGLARLLFTSFCPTRDCACATYFGLLPNTATPNIANEIYITYIYKSLVLSDIL